MLTIQNFQTEFAKNDYVRMAEELAKMNDKYATLIDFANNATKELTPLVKLDKWKEMIEEHPGMAEIYQAAFDMLNTMESKYNDLKPSVAPRPKATRHRAAAARAKKASTASKQPQRKASAVKAKNGVRIRPIDEDIPPEIRFMERYIKLDGKVLNVSRAHVLLASMQKAILGKKIRKSSKFANEIRNIQNNLVKLVNNYEDGTLISIDKDTVADYTAKIIRNYPLAAIRLLKSYAFLVGKNETIFPQIQTRAKKILAQLSNLSRPGKYAREVEAAKQSLEDFINGASAFVQPTDVTLRGLLGLDGAEGLNGPVSSTALANYHFQTIELAPDIRSLIGEPDIPFKILIHGLPGSGKTTLALQIAHSLAEHNQMRVLFISAEEGMTNKTQKRLDRLSLYSDNMDIAVGLPSDLQQYDVVAIDSITALRMAPEEMRELYRNNPSTSFILISQSTKSGTARGSLEFEHDVDTTIRCEDMTAHVVKNRFGDCSTARI